MLVGWFLADRPLEQIFPGGHKVDRELNPHELGKRVQTGIEKPTPIT